MPETKPVDELVAQLWTDYKSNGAPDARERLILHYSPLVKFVAGRVGAGLPQSVEQADLASNGVFGLIDAIEKFDPARGFKFETYAVARIKGAIIDEMRKIDWVTRLVRGNARKIDAAYSRLENELRRSPTDTEVAVAVGMSEEELRATLSQISCLGLVALDETLSAGRGGEGGSTTVGDTIADPTHDPVTAYETDETFRLLAEGMERMGDRDRLVLTLYYYENLTLAQIGSVLGVTESRVCQIHTKALSRLRTHFVGAERG